MEARNPRCYRSFASQACEPERRLGHNQLAAQLGGIEAQRLRVRNLGGEGSACCLDEALVL